MSGQKAQNEHTDGRDASSKGAWLSLLVFVAILSGCVAISLQMSLTKDANCRLLAMHLLEHSREGFLAERTALSSPACSKANAEWSGGGGDHGPLLLGGYRAARQVSYSVPYLLRSGEGSEPTSGQSWQPWQPWQFREHPICLCLVTVQEGGRDEDGRAGEFSSEGAIFQLDEIGTDD